MLRTLAGGGANLVLLGRATTSVQRLASMRPISYDGHEEETRLLRTVGLYHFPSSHPAPAH